MNHANAPHRQPLRILGIDPGLRSTGFGVIDQRGAQLVYVASGCVTSTASQPLPQRIGSLVDGLGEIIQRYQPQAAAVEIVFVNVNAQSTLLLGQARGATLAVLALAKLPVAEYTALQVKQAVVGHGKAAKNQVQQMVMRLLNLAATPAADAADALACAICHAHSGQVLGRLAAAHSRVPRGRLT